MEAIRDEIVERRKRIILNELTLLHQASEEEDEGLWDRRRNSVARQLRRLKPGAATGLVALKKRSGNITTDPQEIAKELEEYWQEIFKKKEVDEKRLREWLKEECDEEGSVKSLLLGVESKDWALEHHHAKKAIDNSGDSAPGPDGIPYVAWRKLGVMGQSLIFRATKELMLPEGIAKMREAYGQDGEDQHQFNEAIMAFLPKKPCATMGTIEVYEAGGTRPLSIVNTDNRLIASTLRMALEPVLCKVISENQRGFLRGRSLIANVVDTEEAMMKFSLEEEKAAAIFFDFAAAFPSLAHRYLEAALKEIGLPEEYRRAIAALYDGHIGRINIGGKGIGAISIEAGIRQGCPLSPLIFALVGDLLIRKLKRQFAGACIKAYADDIAMVCRDFWGNIGDINDVFADFATISGLHLNFQKVQVVPLWLEDLEAIRRRLGGIRSGWGTVKMGYAAEYLGFFVGPGKGNRSWKRPLEKYYRKAKEWGGIGTGLNMAMAAYNIYVLPTLLFIAQLEGVPREFARWEAKALGAMSKGPRGWSDTEMFKSLKEWFGMPMNAKNLDQIANASKVRVAISEKLE